MSGLSSDVKTLQEELLRARETIVMKNNIIVENEKTIAKEKKSVADLMVMMGSSYIRRDVDRLGVQKTLNGKIVEKLFPNGEELKTLYTSISIPFQILALDIETVIESRSGVPGVIRKIFEFSKSIVDEYVEPKKKLLIDEFGFDPDLVKNINNVGFMFYHATMQCEIISILNLITPTLVEESIEDEELLYINRQMKENNSEVSLMGLISEIIKFHFYCLFSVPKIGFYPEIGDQVKYNKSKHIEILSPGTRQYGRITEGETVSVAIPGVVFYDADGEIISNMAEAYVMRNIEV